MTNQSMEEHDAFFSYNDFWEDNIKLLNRSLPEQIEVLERDSILTALSNFNGNRTLAAKELGIGRTNLIAKIKKYQI